MAFVVSTQAEGGHVSVRTHRWEITDVQRVFPVSAALTFSFFTLILFPFSGLLLFQSEGRQEAEVVRLPQLVIVEVGDDDLAAVVLAVSFLAVAGCLLWFVALQHLLSSAPCL